MRASGEQNPYQRANLQTRSRLGFDSGGFGFAVTGDLPFVIALLDGDDGRTEFKDRTCDLIRFRFGGIERTRSEERNATYERQRMFFYFVHTIL